MTKEAMSSKPMKAYKVTVGGSSPTDAKKVIEIVLVQLEFNSTDVIHDLHSQNKNMRLATLEEFQALLAQQPDIRFKFSIVVPGSVDCQYDEMEVMYDYWASRDRSMPVFEWEQGRPVLRWKSYIPHETKWGGKTRFALVRK